MKKSLLTLTILLCTLLIFSTASAIDLVDACPHCGNTDLGWFALVTPDGKDAHKQFCEPCYAIISESELCEPLPGTATCIGPERCKVCNYHMTETMSPDPDAHNWCTPQYTWTALNNEEIPVYDCSVIRICNNYCGTAQAESVEASHAITTPSTCIQMGVVTYTASFEASWAETQVMDKPWNTLVPNHTRWLDTKYYFSSKTDDPDNREYVGIAYRRCADCTHRESETVDATWAVTLEPTCTELGKITYTAVFESEWADSYSDVLISLPTKRHSYEATTIAPTCLSDGYTMHTCSDCGKTYTDSATKALVHWYGAWNPNQDGTHSAECKRGCGHVATTACTLYEVTMTDGETILTVCPVCGGYKETAFAVLPESVISAGEKTVLPRGEQIVRGMDAPFDGVLYAFTAAYEYAGKVQPFEGLVSVAIPLDAEKYSEFKLVRVDVTPATEDAPRAEAWTDLSFTFEDGKLAFETDAAGLFLLIPQQ